MKDRSAT